MAFCSSLWSLSWFICLINFRCSRRWINKRTHAARFGHHHQGKTCKRKKKTALRSEKQRGLVLHTPPLFEHISCNFDRVFTTVWCCVIRASSPPGDASDRPRFTASAICKSDMLHQVTSCWFLASSPFPHSKPIPWIAGTFNFFLLTVTSLHDQKDQQCCFF